MLTHETNHNSFLSASKIQEVSHHTQLLKDWSLSYNQLTSGKFESYLNELNFEGIQLYEEKLTPSIFQRGTGKQDCLCLGMFSSLSEPAVWKGQNITGQEIIAVSHDEEIMLRTPQQSSFYALSIPFSFLSENHNDDFSLLKSEVKILSDERLATALHAQFCALFSTILNQPLSVAMKNSRKQIKSELTALGIRYLDGLHTHHTQIKTSIKKANSVVKLSLEALENSQDQILSVEDLCLLTHTSRRTLQNCFEQITGQSPALFLKHVRLNTVKNILVQSPEPVTISNVAMDWGFWHLSQFAVDYKRLFGESPSQTLMSNQKFKHRFDQDGSFKH
ncbi:helix-turn-helix domain-containing protein [Acinetobacter sp.]|uniref:helix-turn-helix domain-containing protein n=1 Tax=Acinetobacter sp. TaxID=472 RepID=UPI0031DB2091